ncbi:acyl-CoA dehydrogenase [Aurantiacibacter zhengii]|nr:acyl-CoA dehydrogenase [Aurantiacibacter zhengii]
MAADSSVSPISRPEMEFQLFDVLNILELAEREQFAEYDRDTVRATLELAETLALDSFLPGYRKSDLNEPVVEDDKVKLIPEIGQAIDAFVEAGFMSAHLPLDEGGMQMPWSLLQSCYSMFQASNIGATIYYFLTVSAANVLREHGTEEQKRLFMAPLLAGRFLATMCLSEPEAGSSLTDLRTKAIPNDDGTYRIVGTKMWISGGDHDLSENIIHLVLARIEGALPGTKGISLFVVPKFRVNEDASVGESNNIARVGLNHKMGYRAATNTVLNFGEDGDCIGYLVGEEHRGLAPMFLMMNEARISVGAGATMLGHAGYLYSLAYAKERKQGRPVDGKDPEASPIPISEHADVRRMLLVQKAYTEGALALCLYAAYLVDEEKTAKSQEDRDTANALLAILTPIVKSWPSEFCLEANKMAIQVLGGYGYTIDYPVEQYYRDNRLNLIHEGTNGIQAIDLVSRKLISRGGAYWQALKAQIVAEIEECSAIEQLAPHAASLTQSLDMADETVTVLQGLSGDPSQQTANASFFQDALGHICVGWMWLRQGRASLRALDGADASNPAEFYRGKLAAMRYFFRYELGRVDHWLHIVRDEDRLLEEVDTACL